MKTGPSLDNKIFARLIRLNFMKSLALSFTGMIDCAMVGLYLGAEGLASMKIAMPIFAVLSLFSSVFASGLAVRLSRHLSKGDRRASVNVVNSVITISLVIGCICLIAGIFGSFGMTKLLTGRQGSEALILGAMKYLRPILIGASIIILHDILGSVALLDGAIDSFRNAALVLFVVDLAGDLLTIKTGLGLSGIAIASVLAYGGAFLVILYHFRPGNTMFRFSLVKPAWHEIIMIIRLGLPMAVNYICKIIFPISVNRSILHFGTLEGLAALSIQDAVQYVPRALTSGISNATLLMTGIFSGEQDAGSLKKERAMIVKWSVIGGGIMAIILAIAAPLIMMLFTTDPEVYALSVTALRLYLIGVPFICLNYASIAFLQGLGMTVLACLYTFIDHGLLAVASAWILGRSMGNTGVFLSFAACEIISLFILGIIVLFKKVTGKDTVPDMEAFSSEYELRRTIKTVEDAVSASNEIHDILISRHIDKRKAYIAALCAEELAVNSVEHGFKKDNKEHTADLRAAFTNDTMILRLRDDCRRFDLTQRNRIIDPEDHTRNIGLRIIFGNASDVSYSSSLNMNNVCIKVDIGENEWNV